MRCRHGIAGTWTVVQGLSRMTECASSTLVFARMLNNQILSRLDCLQAEVDCRGREAVPKPQSRC